MAKPPEKDSYAALRSAGLLLAIPTLLIVAPLAGFFLGWFLERWVPFRPWLSIVGLVLGFVAAGRETANLYRRALAEEEAKSGRKEGGRRS
jgi:F0F1-type ATP synthase assembly protein I